ncbi:MAG: hypothetical protein R8K46_08295 [Mariprofundaceae bacterium]
MLASARLAPAGATALEAKKEFFIVSQYHYEPGDLNETKETGLAICSTRCNGLSDNFANYIQPRGWRLVKTAGDQERVIESIPFLKGKCVCIGDEYRIEWYNPSSDSLSSEQPIPFGQE